MKPTSKIKIALTKLLGLSLCILPPLICTFSFFPVWIARGGEYVISGITLFLALLCALPMYRLVSRKLRSAAAYTVWLILFIIFFSLSKIADEVTIISFFGFIGNLLGAILLKKARKLDTEVD